MDLASRLGRLFHRTSQPAFYVRIVAALLVLERLRLMIPDIKKKFKHLAFILVKKKAQMPVPYVQIGVNVGLG